MTKLLSWSDLPIPIEDRVRQRFPRLLPRIAGGELSAKRLVVELGLSIGRATELLIHLEAVGVCEVHRDWIVVSDSGEEVLIASRPYLAGHPPLGWCDAADREVSESDLIQSIKAVFPRRVEVQA